MKMVRREKMDEVEAAFYKGVAAIAAGVARDHGEPTFAKDLLHSEGITLDLLEAAGVDPFDLKPLRKALKR